MIDSIFSVDLLDNKNTCTPHKILLQEQVRILLITRYNSSLCE